MAMLTPPMPRFKPQAPQEPQQVLRAPPPQMATATGRTPAQIAKERELAQAMIGQGLDFSPVQHWTQGAARLANELAGLYDESRLAKEETEGKKASGAKLQAILDDPGIDPKDRLARVMAYREDPFADKSLGDTLLSREMPTPQQPTDDQREYEAAKQGGFGGTFMDYMQALKTPVFQPPQGYAVAPDSRPGAPKVVRAEGLPADPAAAPKPTVQKAEDEDIAAVQGVQSINAQLDGIDSMIAGGKLDLGLFNNLGARAQNMLGASTENSTNFATMMSTLEKMRNDSLRLNSGVQTEGDAVRAWNELVSNVNDPRVVRAQITRIKELNQRAAAQRLQLINIRRQRNNMEAFDPASVALPGTPETFTPPDTTGAGAPAAGGPQPGTIEDGMRFKGGNPADPNNWEPVAGGQGGPEDPYGLQDLTRQREEMLRRHKMRGAVQ